MGGRKGFRRISETEFASVLATLSATAKGRAFLEEYRRRLKPAETLGLIDSLKRIETTMASVSSQLQPERIAGEIQHIAMSLDIAVDGAKIDPEGDETARRFALVDRARRELSVVADTLLGPSAPTAKPTRAKTSSKR
jgi:hypothetical protein